MAWSRRARFIALALLALSPPVLLPAGPARAEPVFPPGSRIGIEPPAGMEPSHRFSGFENPSRAAAITFVEMPTQAYSELQAGFSPELLGRQGMNVQGQENLRVGGHEAFLVVGDQQAGAVTLRKWMLVVGEPSLTALVIAQTVAGEAGYSDETMRAALASLALRPALPIESQIAALPFKVGNLAGFRPVRVVAGNSLYLTDGPNDQVQAADQPVIILAQSIGRVPPQPDRPAFARQIFLAGAGLTDLAVERSQSFRQGGADWHEIVARGKEPSGQEVVMSQAIRFAPDGYVRMVGIARTGVRDAFLPRFRAVVDSVDVE